MSVYVCCRRFQQGLLRHVCGVKNCAQTSKKWLTNFVSFASCRREKVCFTLSLFSRVNASSIALFCHKDACTDKPCASARSFLCSSRVKYKALSCAHECVIVFLRVLRWCNHRRSRADTSVEWSCVGVAGESQTMTNKHLPRSFLSCREHPSYNYESNACITYALCRCDDATGRQ